MNVPTDEVGLELFRNAFSEAVRIYAQKGVDLPASLRNWADRYLRTLRDRGAGYEMDVLLRKGCEKLPLAIVTRVSVFLAAIPRIHYETLGDLKRLKYLVGQFESTAALFDGIHRALSIDGEYTWPVKEIVPSPEMMAAHLRWYKFLDFAPTVADKLKVNSSEDIERYFLTAYVKHSTKGWRDKEVSAIITVATGRRIDERVLKTWRNRSYDRIQLHGEFAARLAQLVGEVCHKS